MNQKEVQEEVKREVHLEENARIPRVTQVPDSQGEGKSNQIQQKR